MPFKLSSILCTIFLLLILSCPSLASFLASIFSTPETLCDATPYPNFCKNSLPYDKPGTIHDYGRISIYNSLSHARHFLSSVEYLLRLPSTIFVSTIHALEDCQVLAQLNIEWLSSTLESINSINDLQSFQATDIQTLLSATLTNLDTCLDGLQFSKQASSILNDMWVPLSNGTMHYSVSLALFTHGWVAPTKKGRFLTERKRTSFNMENSINEGLPLRMSNPNQRIFESTSKRKLLQTTGASVGVRQVVIVNPNGIGNFTTINDAVAAAPNNTDTSNGYFLIYVVHGVYEEYVSIPKYKKYILMIGDGIGKTVVTGNRSAVDGWTTFNSATFAILGVGFVAVNMTFRNTAGASKYQAVAVRNGADMSTFYSCSIEGYQDTLYAHSLRQFYRDSEIYGTIDYIFGNAAAVFQNCRIYSRLPLNNQFNTITAQGRTDPNQNTGISIQNCSIKAANDLAALANYGTVKTYLGRPWKNYSRTIFMQSCIDSLIDPAGWAPWSGDFALTTLYYAEFSNNGGGSNTTSRVTWPGYHVINAIDAANFTASNFIQGDYWLPATRVPYTGGLM